MATAEEVARLESFSTALAEHDSAWAALQAEKQAGWESDAVDWKWKQRDELFRGKVDRTQHRGLVPFTAKYVRFYREWMPRLSPELFGQPCAAGAPRRPLFVDIGAAPGGMCEYLVGDLGWRGHAFSLAPTDEGFGMQFSHPDLGYTDADLSVVGAWQDLLRLVPPGSVEFVNGGIVVDRGQSRDALPPSRAAAPAAAAGHATTAASDAPAAAGGGGRGRAQGGEEQAGESPVSLAAPGDAQDENLHPLMHRIILQNECVFGLHALAPGGCLYFAFQRASWVGVGVLFRLLLGLRPAFVRLRVTPTFAAGRTPVYVFCEGYAGAGSAGAAAALHFLLDTPLSDVDGWSVCEWDEAVASLHAEIEGDLRLVWGECTAHLKRQRVEAEMAMEAAMAAGVGGPAIGDASPAAAMGVGGVLASGAGRGAADHQSRWGAEHARAAGGAARAGSGDVRVSDGDGWTTVGAQRAPERAAGGGQDYSGTGSASGGRVGGYGVRGVRGGAGGQGGGGGRGGGGGQGGGSRGWDRGVCGHAGSCFSRDSVSGCEWRRGGGADVRCEVRAGSSASAVVGGTHGRGGNGDLSAGRANPGGGGGEPRGRSCRGPEHAGSGRGFNSGQGGERGETGNNRGDAGEAAAGGAWRMGGGEWRGRVGRGGGTQ